MTGTSEKTHTIDPEIRSLMINATAQISDLTSVVRMLVNRNQSENSTAVTALMARIEELNSAVLLSVDEGCDEAKGEISKIVGGACNP